MNGTVGISRGSNVHQGIRLDLAIRWNTYVIWSEDTLSPKSLHLVILNAGNPKIAHTFGGNPEMKMKPGEVAMSALIL